MPLLVTGLHILQNNITTKERRKREKKRRKKKKEEKKKLATILHQIIITTKNKKIIFKLLIINIIIIGLADMMFSKYIPDIHRLTSSVTYRSSRFAYTTHYLLLSRRSVQLFI